LSQEHSELSQRIGRIPALIAGYRTHSEIQIETFSNNLMLKLESLEIELEQTISELKKLNKANDFLASNNVILTQEKGIEIAKNRDLYDQLLLVVQERDRRYAELINALAERDQLFSEGMRLWLIGKVKSRGRRFRQRVVGVVNGTPVKRVVRDFAMAMNARLKRYPRIRLKLIKILLASPKLEGLMSRILASGSPIIQTRTTVASDLILARSIQQLLSMPK
jgi:hypothetical protein